MTQYFRSLNFLPLLRKSLLSKPLLRKLFFQQEEKKRHCEIKATVLEHHLRLFGLQNLESVEIQVGGVWQDVDPKLKGGQVVVVLEPSPAFLEEGGISFSKEPPGLLTLEEETSWGPLRTLHETLTFDHSKALTIARTAAGAPTWIKFNVLGGTLFLIGSDVAGDLIRYRQGDPAAVRKENEELWGFDSERPVYLFEGQLEGLHLHERPADVIAMSLMTAICSALGVSPTPLLPNGAPGAIVITGDDDQAYLEKYQEQLELLEGLPITYFLHPETRHTEETLGSMLASPNIDLGLHPDALESPKKYDSLFSEQSRWFERLVGAKSKSLRNHGFLNAGYWGHLRAWLKEGVDFSSNLPGLNGRVLNGSLLPARVAIHNNLTSHWSIVTAIGDGVVFALEMDQEESADVIKELARSVISSGIPGVIVVNLHPQNISETKSMHIAIKDVVAEGFLAWNMSQCFEWFNTRDCEKGDQA